MMSKDDGFEGRTSVLLYAVTLISLVALVILVLLTTNLMLDTVYFIDQIQLESFFIDIVVILFGGIGFVYYFILPGLPLLLLVDGQVLSSDYKRILMITVYSSVGNFAILLSGLLIGYPIIGAIAPLVLFMTSLVFRILNDAKESKEELRQMGRIRWPHIRKKPSISAVAGIILISISLIIRLIIFNSNVVEYSDVIVYHNQIISISINDYLLNSEFTARAPLYTMFSYQMSFFTPTQLSGLKTVSFMFSILLLVPAISIMKTLSNNKNSVLVNIGFPVIFAIYPWNLMMASVALQDILLTYYIISFFALILLDERSTIIAAGITAGLAFLCRYSLGLLGPIGILYLAFRNHREGLRDTIGFSFLWAATVGTWILRNFLVAGVPFSTTDEGLFSLSNFIPGIINIVKQFSADRHGMNSATFWIPIIVGLLLVSARESNFERIKRFFSLDYLFIYITLLGQMVVLAFFHSQQYRFMLSIIWFFPILWVLLMESFDIPGKNLMLLGWIFFSITHSINIFRNYWVFHMGRLPVASNLDLYNIMPAIMPAVGNAEMAIIALLVIASLTALILLFFKPPNQFSHDGDKIEMKANEAIGD
jgi:hypothetical protein